MKIRYLLGLAASLSAAPPLLYGQIAFHAVLTADQVVQDPGPSLSGAGAFATFELAGDKQSLDYRIQLFGLDLDGQQTPDNPDDDVTGIHLHLGSADANGERVLNIFGAPREDDADMIFDPVAGIVTGTFDDTDATPEGELDSDTASAPFTSVRSDLFAGGLYVQVHSALNASPRGELRGQISQVVTQNYSGSWFNTTTDGQGYALEHLADQDRVLAYWFTFDADGTEQRWFVADGTLSGNTATLTIFETTGGSFSTTDPVTTRSAGSLVVVFSSCTSATVTYSFSDQSLGNGTFDIQRISPPLGCVDGSVVQGGTRALELRFAAMVNDEPATCGQSYQVGPGADDDITLNDLRFFVHELTAIQGDHEIAIGLDQSAWQYGEVALLDFEDGCGTGNPDTNAIVTGTVADADIDGICLTVGIPDYLNHVNPDLQPSPLNVSAMFWNWNDGYKFIRVDGNNPNITDDTGRFNIHLGSAGCGDTDKTTPPTESCTFPNRPRYCFEGFDPDAQTLVFDVGAVLQDSTIVNTPATRPGCMADPSDPECQLIMPRLGVDFTFIDGVNDPAVFPANPSLLRAVDQTQ